MAGDQIPQRKSWGRGAGLRQRSSQATSRPSPPANSRRAIEGRSARAAHFAVSHDSKLKRVFTDQSMMIQFYEPAEETSMRRGRRASGMGWERARPTVSNRLAFAWRGYKFVRLIAAMWCSPPWWASTTSSSAKLTRTAAGFTPASASLRSHLHRRRVSCGGGYLVTAAISGLSAFQYLGVPHPERFARAGNSDIGALNYFGPDTPGAWRP